jgi:hypothetical protein
MSIKKILSSSKLFIKDPHPPLKSFIQVSEIPCLFIMLHSLTIDTSKHPSHHGAIREVGAESGRVGGCGGGGDGIGKTGEQASAQRCFYCLERPFPAHRISRVLRDSYNPAQAVYYLVSQVSSGSFTSIKKIVEILD